ncbi:MAG: hypothetical protein LBQ28_02630 [Prevotellaceae bacterium]|jgi:uncharacterized protein YciU (UPF0263 family)|nr:hypothetical protein [Prevotellaceae bacterium]
MKKLLSIFVFLQFTFTTSSQQITFSSEIKNSTDENVRQIAAVWEKYVNKIVQQSDSAAILYWNTKEEYIGNKDIIRYDFGDGLYYRVDQFVYNIKPSTNKDFYEINCLSLNKSADNINDILACFRICAKKENGEFKLYNYFYTIKDNINKHSVDGIDYYYPHNYKFDYKKAQQASDFLKNIRQKYNLQSEQNVVFIVANSLDECNELIGFHYTVVSTTIENAGYAMFPRVNILLSSTITHYHELIHSIFSYSFKDISSLLSEGIATYYGGNAGIQLPELKKNFRQYIAENVEIDLSNLNSINKLLSNGTNPYYIIGALIIDHALKNGGEQAVLRLFEYSDDNIYDMFTNKFGIKREDIHNFILKLLNDE